MEIEKQGKLENVWCEVTGRVSSYGRSKGVSPKPTRCIKILDSVQGLKDHYWLRGTTYLGKGEKVKLMLKMFYVVGYGYRVKEWKYVL